MSINHQYYHLQGNGIYKRYKKTILGQLSLWRPSTDLTSKEVVILATPEQNASWVEKKDNDGDTFLEAENIGTFSYDDEVLETYTEREDRLFRRLNEKLFVDGLIVEYTDNRSIVTYENALTDSEIEILARTKFPAQLNKKLETITSPVTVQRILTVVKEIGRPKSIVTILENKLHATNNTIT